VAEAFNRRLVQRVGGDSIRALRDELRAAVSIEAATDERMMSLLVGAAPHEFLAVARRLNQEPQFLPAQWRNGGLLIHVDALLERAASLEQMPYEAGARLGASLATGFLVTPTESLTVNVTDGSGAVVYRTSIGRLGSMPSQWPVPAAARSPALSRFKVTLQHPKLEEAKVTLDAESDGQGLVNVLAPNAAAQQALAHLWSSLQRVDAVFSAQPAAPPRTPTGLRSI
jgi:hypothetical protein